MLKGYYKAARGIAKIVCPKRAMVRCVEDDGEPAIYVCNHSGLIGPVNMTLYFDKPARSWLISYLFEKDVAPNFIFHDFFFGRSKFNKLGWRMIAKIVSVLLPPLLLNENPIIVYKNSIKIKDTFNDSVQTLMSGKQVVVFSESHIKYSKYINELCDGFVDIAKYYYKATGKCVKFYPTYVGNGLKTINAGIPIAYNPNASGKDERRRIAKYCQDEIDRLATSLPKHKPVPFVTKDYYDYYSEFVGDDIKYWQFVDQKRSN